MTSTRAGSVARLRGTERTIPASQLIIEPNEKTVIGDGKSVLTDDLLAAHLVNRKRGLLRDCPLIDHDATAIVPPADLMTESSNLRGHSSFSTLGRSCMQEERLEESEKGERGGQ